MRVREVMTRQVHMVRSDETVQAAAQLMAEIDTGTLLVGAPDHLEGILTDRDIIIRVVARGLDGAIARVAEVMSSSLFDCHEDTTVEEAMVQMGQRQVRRLPVLDDSGRLVGLVTEKDLLRVLAS